MTYRRAQGAFVLVICVLAVWSAYLGACRGAGDAPDDPTTSEGDRGVAWRLGPHGAGPAQWVRLEPGETHALVIYGGVTHGAIEACGCSGNPTGGLTKECTVVRELRRRGTPSVYLHPGDLFPFEKEPAKMAFIAEAASRMGYDAMAVGEQELIEGLARFRELAAAHKLPYLSANLRDGDGRRIAPATVIKDIAGIKVGIIAVLGAERYLYLDESFLKDVTIDPVADTVAAGLAELETRVDYVILLSHQDKYLDREVARRFPRINLIVGGHDEELIPRPIRIGQTLLVNAGVLGERVGVVHLAIDPSRHVRVLGHEFVPTTAPVPKHPGIEEIYTKYIKASRAEREVNDPVLPEVHQAPAACEPCHKAICAEYKKSRHARAWQTLVEAGRATESACWYCHTMGYGREGGFRNIKDTPELANVSCQACHPVTHDHRDRGLGDTLERCQDERTCQQCHTAVTSPEFNFWDRGAEIDHHAVTPKSHHPPPGYTHWRVKGVRKAPHSVKPLAAGGDKAAEEADRR